MLGPTFLKASCLTLENIIGYGKKPSLTSLILHGSTGAYTCIYRTFMRQLIHSQFGGLSGLLLFDLSVTMTEVIKLT